MSDQPVEPKRAATQALFDFLGGVPWWIVIVAVVGTVVGFSVLSNVKYIDAFYFLFDLPWDKALLDEILTEEETWSFTPDSQVPLTPGQYAIYAELNAVRATTKEETPLYAEPATDSAQTAMLSAGERVNFLKWHLIPRQGAKMAQNWVHVETADGRTGWALDKSFSGMDYEVLETSDPYLIQVMPEAQPVTAAPITQPTGKPIQVNTSIPTLQGTVSGGAIVRLYDRYDWKETLARFWNSKGVMLTLRATLLGFGLALILGLFAGLMLVSHNPILLAIAKLYVEVIRGVPLLVIILYAGFVIAPWLRDATGGKINLGGFPGAVIGLGFGYGAYLAEVFRAGIQSIHYGQMEAARSLGMSYFQAMRYVVLPQAVRVVLPPLGNDFVAMLKDSSLISVVALPEILQQGRLWVSRTFRAFEGYNTVALFYLVMTLLLSLLVRVIEKKTKLPGRSED